MTNNVNEKILKGNVIDLRLWRLQRNTALLALILIALHLIIQLVIFKNEIISFDVVSKRLQNFFLLAVDVSLLIVVSIHAFLGFRSIVLDYINRSIILNVLTKIMISIIIFTILYGTFALIAFI